MTPYSLFDHYFKDKVREVLKQYGPYKVLCLFKKETVKQNVVYMK